MDDLTATAVWGAVGAALGTGVAWLIAKALRRSPRWLLVIPVAFMATAAAAERVSRPLPADDVLAALAQSPAVRALKMHYPDDYSRLEARIRALGPKGSTGEIDRALGETLGPVMLRQRAKADADVSYDLYEVSRAEAEALGKSNPAACAAHMEGRGSPAELVRAVPREVLDRDRRLSTHLLVQTATTPAPPVPAMSIDELVKLSFEGMAKMSDADQDVAIAILREERDPATPDEARIMCDFYLGRAAVILARPKPVAGDLVRRMWAME